VFGVRLSAPALDLPAHRTNTRVSPHDLKYLGGSQEYGTDITYSSIAGIGWPIDQSNSITPSSVLFQLEFYILLTRVLSESFLYNLVNARATDICIIMKISRLSLHDS